MKTFTCKTLAFALLLSLSLQAADTFNIIISHYLFNYENALSKCENKLRPNLKCNGSCQLMKTLKEKENNNSQSQTTLQKSDIILLDLPICNPLVVVLLPCISMEYNSSLKKNIKNPFLEIAIPPPETMA